MEYLQLFRQEKEIDSNEKKMKKIKEDIGTIRVVLEDDKELLEIFSDSLIDIKTKIDDLNQVLQKQLKELKSLVKSN